MQMKTYSVLPLSYSFIPPEYVYPYEKLIILATLATPFKTLSYQGLRLLKNLFLFF